MVEGDFKIVQICYKEVNLIYIYAQFGNHNCGVECVVQGVKIDLLDYNKAPSRFYVKCSGESDSATFFHFRSS